MAKPKRSKAEKEEEKRKRRAREKRREAGEQVASSRGPEGRRSGLPHLPPEVGALLAMASTGDWRSIGSDDYGNLVAELRLFDPYTTIGRVAALLTVPTYQVATLRIEILTHLAVAHCYGKREAAPSAVANWVNASLARLMVRRMEDPLEDVFVSNVIGPGGNFRIFEGIWESSDRALQALLDAFLKTAWGQKHSFVLRPAVALLRLSDAVADRAGVGRWDTGSPTDPLDSILNPAPDVAALAQRVMFTRRDLDDLRIPREDLTPFLFSPALRTDLLRESLGNTSLERFPLLDFGDSLVFALPTAASPAIRRYVIEACTRAGALQDFRRALAKADSRTIIDEGLRLIDAPTGVGAAALPATPAAPPPPPIEWSEVHCPIDEDKLAQLILLHDAFEGLPESGLSEPHHDRALNERLAQHVQRTVAYLARQAAGGWLSSFMAVSDAGSHLASLSFRPGGIRWFSA